MDAETHKILDIISTRECAEVAKHLKQWTQVQIVTRDGALSYSKAIREANPDVVQVNDRFHILCNLTDGVKQFLMRTLPCVIDLGEDTEQKEEPNKDREPARNQSGKEESMTSREQKQKQIDPVREDYASGKCISKIVEERKLSRNTVRKYVRSKGLWMHGGRGRRSACRGGKIQTYRS